MLSAGLLDENSRSVPSCSSHQAIRKANLSVKTLSTLIWRSTLLLAAFGSAGCSARTAGSAELQSLTPASAAAIDQSARTFMHTVAHDVTLKKGRWRGSSSSTRAQNSSWPLTDS
jgi:hypothetical protein